MNKTILVINRYFVKRANYGLSVIIWIFLVLLNAFPLLSYAQNIRKVKLVSFTESYRDTRLTSGDLFIAVNPSSKSAIGILDGFYAYIETTQGRRLCLQVRSRDGRYLAQAEFDLTGIPTGVYEFEYPSKLRKKLKDYKGDDIALRLSLKNDCNTDIDPELICVPFEILKNTGLSTI